MYSINNLSHPTENLLDMYLEILAYLDEKTFLSLKISKCLMFFDVNPDKAQKLIGKIYEFGGYHSFEDLKMVLKKFKEHGYGRKGNVLLNLLARMGEISNAQAEELAFR